MNKTLKSLWKAVGVFSVLLGIAASLLQISGTIDLGSALVLPIHSFLLKEIPTYYAVLLLALILITIFLAAKLRRRKGILERVSARAIVSLCGTPKTTESLQREYDHWHRGWIAAGEPSFYEFLKLLEKKGFLKFTDGKWQASREALDHVRKYEGKP